MLCQELNLPVQVVASPGRGSEQCCVAQCPDRDDTCYAMECVFTTTDGGEVPVVELKPFAADAI